MARCYIKKKKKNNYLCLEEHFSVVITLVSEYITNIAATVVIPSEVRSHSADQGLKFRHVSVKRNPKFEIHSMFLSPENFILYGSLYLNTSLIQWMLIPSVNPVLVLKRSTWKLVLPV